MKATQQQKGFSLLEVMISMVVMMVGLVALLGVFGLAMASTQTSQQNGISKQLANEALEGILTARETANVTWAQIANTGSGGIFLSGFQPIDLPGLDGIIGTADDAAAGPQTLNMPGPDGVFGTADDVQLPLNNYQRQIAIVPATDAGGNPIPTLDVVTITIQYTNPQLKIPQNYVLTTYLSQYR
ncbi:MAG TPA: prepilin-type N-terminal cleavage/methylation domain-containing protein [Blastocatellia bacterium]|nr:prepilin-type N-terminal cleavage/methylation domain-containing protein [Blastocatellia bacterium]